MSNRDFTAVYFIACVIGAILGWSAHSILAERGPVEVTHLVECRQPAPLPQCRAAGWGVHCFNAETREQCRDLDGFVCFHEVQP